MIPIHFAPLQGYTEAPYRCIHQELIGGIAAYYTPFIRLEHGKLRKKDLREVLPESNNGVHVIPQIIAADASEFSILAEKIFALGYEELDFNMGCPFPLQVRQGRGSGLLAHYDNAAAILEKIVQLTSQGKHISVKMRLGQTSVDEGRSLIPLLNDAGLSHLTLHPRLGIEQYKGELHQTDFEEFLQSLTMPVIYNGAILSLSDIEDVTTRFPQLAGIMIGRGLLARPTLSMEYLQGIELEPAERCSKILAMYRRLREHYEQSIEGGDAQLVQKMQSFFEYLEPEFGHKAIKKILKAGSLRNFNEAVANLPR